jgi:hypothetical protein
MRKSLLLALGVALLMTGCASQQSAYGGGSAAGYYLGDCAYEDICGPGLYGTYFYYTPLYPTGPLSPERMKVDLAIAPRVPRVVGTYRIFHEYGGTSGYSSDSGSGYGYGASAGDGSTSVERSAPAPAPGPPAVHTVAPRN